MKKYLKYLGYGFLTLISYYFINLLMAISTLGFYTSFHDEIYGTFGTPRNPNIAITLFVIICILFILILLGFFFFGRALNFRNEKMLFAFILFIIPNLALQILIYNSYSIELMCLLNWFFAPLADVFFYDIETNYDLYYSYFWNSVLTYLPFISAFIGGLTKRKKEFSRLGR
ncbi:MAG: hypothetical protein J1F23_05635 [Oscillospiraceae bacterium]|nr:hypothetical protein [Oscillospiraceae bacterium]